MISDSPDHESVAPSSSGTSATSDLQELQRIRAERDAALEELAFLREQLHSAETFYAHRFEVEYARLADDYRQYLEELTRLSAEFYQRSRRDGPMREDERSAPSDPTDLTDPTPFHG
jgi:hypothetical protein